MNRLTACLYLNLLPHIGAVRALQLVRHCGSPEAVFDTQPERLFADKLLNVATYKALCNWRSHEKDVAQLHVKLEANDWSYWLWDTPNYPRYLKHCPDAPLILFYKGNWKPQASRVISIVGTRRPTAYGRAQCTALLEGLTPYRPTLVSGMAYGIDIFAQRKALELGLDTVSCLAHDLNHMYPRQHQRFCAPIAAQGALVSEFLPGAPFERSNFVRRNRIIAGLAQATIVVETGTSGGSLLTANFANDYHREVFALPGPVDAPKSMGCLQLIKKQMAQLLLTAEDIAQALQWNPLSSQKAPPVKKLVSNDPIAIAVGKALEQEGPCGLDEIAVHTGLAVHTIASKLMVLEMEGAVRSLPGKVFERC